MILLDKNTGLGIRIYRKVTVQLPLDMIDPPEAEQDNCHDLVDPCLPRETRGNPVNYFSPVNYYKDKESLLPYTPIVT